MNGRDRRGRPKFPPGLTEQERREWWLRQRRKYVWGPGDVVITKPGEGKGPEDDDRSKDPGR